MGKENFCGTFLDKLKFSELDYASVHGGQEYTLGGHRSIGLNDQGVTHTPDTGSRSCINAFVWDVVTYASLISTATLTSQRLGHWAD